MDRIATNNLTDERQRYERALLLLAAQLEAQGLPHRLVVDDRRGGDRVALVTEGSNELVELAFDRHDATRGQAWLLVQSQDAAISFSRAIAPALGPSSRLSPVLRGCLLTTIALANRLATEATALARRFPPHALEPFRAAFPEAQAMVGLRAPLRSASVLRRDPMHRTGEGSVPAYGATVDTPNGRRAARWQPGGGFTLPPSARRELHERRGPLEATALTAMAIIPATMGLADEPHHDERSFDRGDVYDCACDGLPDCDLQACDVGFDLSSCFDLTPDCGALPCDCAF